MNNICSGGSTNKNENIEKELAVLKEEFKEFKEEFKEEFKAEIEEIKDDILAVTNKLDQQAAEFLRQLNRLSNAIENVNKDDSNDSGS